MNEASCHDFNCFVTLTYDDQHLPADGSLRLRDHQLFMKRLRKRLRGVRMKFYMCGEYGETYGRPHYHYILFGVDFLDKVHVETTKSGFKLYQSALLDDIWKVGLARIGDVTFDSAVYVAKYIMKKTTGHDLVVGQEPFNHAYRIVDKWTGEVLSELLPEFSRMSTASAIGKEYFERYASDIYPRDLMIANGAPVRPPRYYDKCFSVDDPLGLAWIKEKRRRRALELSRTPAELAARAYVSDLRLSRLTRGVG